jgi:urease accessory protein
MDMAMGTIITTTTAITATPMADSELFDLMTWMSPAWPIGAFAHSSGLEWAVEAGHVTDRESTRQWLVSLIEYGAIHNDLVIFVHAWRAVRSGDAQALREVAELALASQTGHERRVESFSQGAAFRRIALSTTEGLDLERLLAELDADDLAYPVAAAILFACRDIDLRAGLTAWLHGAVSNLISAAQRLVPLGQTDGQLVLRDCRPAVFTAVEDACALPDGDPFDALGGCTLLADIGCMAHETQYTRLFRT